MKKQVNPRTKAHLIRGAVYMLLLIGVCAIPFTLGQQNTNKRSAARQGSYSTGASDQAGVLNGGSNPALLPWTIVADYPQVLRYPAVTSDGTYVYSGTGDVFDAATNAFFRYDPVANTWTTLGEIGRSTAPMTRIRSDDPDNDEYNPDEAGQRKDHCTLPFEHGVLAVSHLSGHLGRDRGTTALDAPVFRFCKGRPLDLSQAHRIVKAAAAPAPRPRSRRISCAMRTRATASIGVRPSTSCKSPSAMHPSPPRAAISMLARPTAQPGISGYE